MAQTGMETAEIVRGVVAETKAGCNPCGGCAGGQKFQTSEPDNPDCGLRGSVRAPASETTANAITEDSIGIPVIAIGVPTVVDGCYHRK